MTTMITETTMTSTVTEHYAYRDPNVLASALEWRVSWLPGWLLDHNGARAAMLIAEIVAQHGPEPGPRERLLVDSLTGQLGVTAEDAVAAIQRGVE